MNNNEKKEFIKLTTESFIASTLAEEKVELDHSQFINWLIGLASAGFLFVFSNLKDIKHTFQDPNNLLGIILGLIMWSFVITILSALIFKISKTYLLKAYLFLRTFIGLQYSSIQDKLEKININSEPDEWTVFRELYDLMYLPHHKGKQKILKKTDMNPYKQICRITYIICVVAFIVEFCSIFILFYKIAL